MPLSGYKPKYVIHEGIISMGSSAEAIRSYKNNVFVDFIGTKEHLIEVYNAVKAWSSTSWCTTSTAG
jgi:hypothetical protein